MPIRRVAYMRQPCRYASKASGERRVKVDPGARGGPIERQGKKNFCWHAVQNQVGRGGKTEARVVLRVADQAATRTVERL